MPLTIFQKLHDLSLGTVNAALDAASNSDVLSLPVAQQRLRNLMAQKDVLDNNIAESITRTRLATSQQRDKAARVAQLNTAITNILSGSGADDDKNKAAMPKMAEKMHLEADLKKLSDTLAAEATTNGTLQEAMHLLDSKVDEMKASIDELSSTQHQARAQEEASSALKNASEVVGNAVGANLDSQIGRANERKVKSDVDLERQVSRLKEVTNADVDNSDVSDALADFKKNMKPATAAA
jgi:phage shock protein A